MASLSDVLLREGAFALSRPSYVHQVLHFTRLRVQLVDVLLRVVLEPNADDYPLALVLDRLTGQIRLDDDDVLSRHFIRSLFVLGRAGTLPWVPAEGDHSMPIASVEQLPPTSRWRQGTIGS